MITLTHLPNVTRLAKNTFIEAVDSPRTCLPGIHIRPRRTQSFLDRPIELRGKFYHWNRAKPWRHWYSNIDTNRLSSVPMFQCRTKKPMPPNLRHTNHALAKMVKWTEARCFIQLKSLLADVALIETSVSCRGSKCTHTYTHTCIMYWYGPASIPRDYRTAWLISVEVDYRLEVSVSRDSYPHTLLIVEADTAVTFALN